MVNSERSIPPVGSPARQQLVASLASQVTSSVGKAGDLERQSWICTHTHIHGIAPLEYDIRPVPEALYLEVLTEARQQQAA